MHITVFLYVQKQKKQRNRRFPVLGVNDNLLFQHSTRIQRDDADGDHRCHEARRKRHFTRYYGRWAVVGRWVLVKLWTETAFSILSVPDDSTIFSLLFGFSPEKLVRWNRQCLTWEGWDWVFQLICWAFFIWMKIHFRESHRPLFVE